MQFTQMTIPDVLLLTPQIYSDHRGRFLETFRISDLVEAGGWKSAPSVVQGNISYSVAWTLRGLHYQYPHPQGKLMRVTSGKIYDVAVDLRKDSPTYGQHVGQVLDAFSCQALWVPPGFAHGFLTFSEGATVHYECTHSYYSDNWAQTLQWDDPELLIRWPIKMGQTPVLSQKDRRGTSFRDTNPIEL